MKKIKFIFKEMWNLIKQRKLFFLSPILFCLVVLTILIYQIGPAIIISFLYAGV